MISQAHAPSCKCIDSPTFDIISYVNHCITLFVSTQNSEMLHHLPHTGIYANVLFEPTVQTLFWMCF